MSLPGLARALLCLCLSVSVHATSPEHSKTKNLPLIQQAHFIKKEHNISTDVKNISISVQQGQFIKTEDNISTVSIAEPSIADVVVSSSKSLYINAKKTGLTSLHLLNKTGEIIAHYHIHVTPNVLLFQQGLKALNLEKNVEVEFVGNTAILKGEVRNPSDGDKLQKLIKQFLGDEQSLINLISIKRPMQINLRVKVVEMSRQIQRTIGFKWKQMFEGGDSKFGLESFFKAANKENSTFLSTIKFPIGNFKIDTLLELLDEDDLLTVLAQPNLTALSGQTASFLAGGEFPIIVPQGNNRVSIEFKEYGVVLSFTPTLLEEKHIRLHVKPEVSQLSSTQSVQLNGFTVPSLITRRAETTVEVESGQSFAIGGLLQNNVSHDVDSLPGLVNLPILGRLFKSEKFKRNETELVIIVTPYIVRPSSAGDLDYPITPSNSVDKSNSLSFYLP